MGMDECRDVVFPQTLRRLITPKLFKFPGRGLTMKDEKNDNKKKEKKRFYFVLVRLTDL